MVVAGSPTMKTAPLRIFLGRSVLGSMTVQDFRPKATARVFLLGAALLTVILWQVPIYGDLALYPFTLLATFAHEMGHGLTAILVGGSFESLVLYPNGAGVASWHGHVGPLERALVAAGGLVGPSVAGAALLAASRDSSRSRVLLYAIGLGMLLTAVAVVRSPFAFAFVSGTGLVLVLAGARLSTGWATFLVQLLGVQLCVALFRDIDYMFSDGGIVAGRSHGSDSAAMAEALLLPFWFWGGVTAVFSAVVLALGLWFALKPQRASSA